MNILIGIEPSAGWVRAAGYLGHKGFALDPARAFDCFHRARPDVVLLPALPPAGRSPVGECLRRWPGVRVVVPGPQRPAADCPPDFAGGRARPEFACDVAVVGDHDPAFDGPLLALAGGGLRLKVFGRGAWPVHQYVGHVPAAELADVYASAGCVADLGGDPALVLAVWAAGGVPVSVGRWEDTGVAGLDGCPRLETPFVRPRRDQNLSDTTRTRDTLSERLRKILEESAPG
jgi:hypothetical protein